MRLTALLGPLALTIACAHTPTEPTAPAPSAPAPAETGSQSPTPGAEPGALPAPDAPAAASRAELSAEQCAALGGRVVGDIGDGAIFRDAYVCPGGAAPLGNIAPGPGGPMAIEGSVCCPG